MDHVRMRLRQVLDGLSYPAERWQIVTWAELYGADTLTRAELAALPAGSYHAIGEIIAAVLAGNAAARPSTAQTTGPWSAAS